MKIAIIGSGGREHALVHQLSKSKKLTKIYSIPGNAGTEEISINIDLNLDNFQDLYNFIKKEQIELVIVGPEKPLVDGLVDFLDSKNIKVFGPRKKIAKLEGSKIFTKKICKKFNIPTARFKICESREDSFTFLSSFNFPLVVKADVLAAGKGVYICQDIGEAKTAVNEIFDGKFGKADQLLIEEFLEGDEMSFFIISDGNSYKTFNTAQDHKRVGEGDTGKNTGGMGAYSPSSLINNDLESKILNKIIEPTLKAIGEMNEKYVGFLYAGLMIKNDEPFLIEYNVRMGDPECQTILPLVDSDLLEIIDACCNSKLDTHEIKWKNKKSMCIVLCSKGYPEKYNMNVEIKNLRKFKSDKDNFIFHAGTKSSDEKVLAIGGRVINFVNTSESFSYSRKEIIKQIRKLNWEDGFYRSDIGYKVINE
ncbi:phosphoribosylamine--glycine ligase [Candidatus Pelagibacter sp.]|nr:phosphoribosylamine--glycine ligase [Candidatus Pelagibacter sp.]